MKKLIVLGLFLLNYSSYSDSYESYEHQVNQKTIHEKQPGDQCAQQMQEDHNPENSEEKRYQSGAIITCKSLEGKTVATYTIGDVSGISDTKLSNEHRTTSTSTTPVNSESTIQNALENYSTKAESTSGANELTKYCELVYPEQWQEVIETGNEVTLGSPSLGYTEQAKNADSNDLSIALPDFESKKFNQKTVTVTIDQVIDSNNSTDTSLTSETQSYCQAVLNISRTSHGSAEAVIGQTYYSGVGLPSQDGTDNRCKGYGTDTQDYNSCVKLVTTYLGFTAVKTVHEQTQQARIIANQQQKQGELAEEQAKDGVRLAAGLEFQKDDVEKQAQIATERAALGASQATALMAMIKSMPTDKSLMQRCNPSEDADQETICANVVKTYGIRWIANPGIRNQIKAYAVEAGVKSISDGMTAAMLGSRAGQIGDQINQLDQFQPLTNPQFVVNPNLDCTQTPDVPECNNVPTTRGFGDPFSGIDFGGRSAINSDITNPAAAIDSVDQIENFNDSEIPSTFGSETFSGGSGFESSVSAAPVKQGGVAGGGGSGGGGGGSAAGVGGSGLSGGGSAAGAAGGSGASSYAGKYSKTGSYRPSLGVVKRKRRSPASNTNPLSKLFKKKANKNGSMRFPAQIGDKSKSLFGMITQRYNKVQSKRLNKYERK